MRKPSIALSVLSVHDKRLGYYQSFPLIFPFQGGWASRTHTQTTHTHTQHTGAAWGSLLKITLARQARVSQYISKCWVLLSFPISDPPAHFTVQWGDFLSSVLFISISSAVLAAIENIYFHCVTQTSFSYGLNPGVGWCGLFACVFRSLYCELIENVWKGGRQNLEGDRAN